MPVLKLRMVRGFTLLVGVTRGGVPDPEQTKEQARKLRKARKRIKRQQLRIRHLQEEQGLTSPDSRGVSPENIVWIFGTARTGSTWLGSMMADLKDHAWWHEPMVGYLFGHLYYERARARREDEHFVLGGDRSLWLDPVRNFVLDSASARFPELIE